jgi:hypothetical protein
VATSVSEKKTSVHWTHLSVRFGFIIAEAFHHLCVEAVKSLEVHHHVQFNGLALPFLDFEPD